MRFMVLCLMLGGCAGRLHWDSTQHGGAVELGFAPTESAGDFNVKMADADTRRLYAEACKETREPAACLFALAAGANPKIARHAFHRGSSVCWGDICRPFDRSARGMAPAGATYDVAAVTAAYNGVVGELSAGPDIERPRPVVARGASVRESVAAAGDGGEAAPASRSANAGTTVPRRESLPRSSGGVAIPSPPITRCDAYPDIQRQYGEEFAKLQAAVAARNVQAARQAFRATNAVLVAGLGACKDDAAALAAIRRMRTQLDQFGRETGLKEEG